MSDQPPHIYVPEDKDDLRDGLFRGFWAHQQKTPAMGAGALKKDDK